MAWPIISEVPLRGKKLPEYSISWNLGVISMREPSLTFTRVPQKFQVHFEAMILSTIREV